LHRRTRVSGGFAWRGDAAAGLALNVTAQLLQQRLALRRVEQSVHRCQSLESVFAVKHTRLIK
jgi:hypothetical protein